jgi:hypothetical protein
VWLLTRCPPLRVIVDPAGSAVTDIPGVYTTADPTGISWPEDAATIRFVPERSLDLKLYDRLYRTLREGLFAGRWAQVTVLCDEAETVMPENRCPDEAAQFVYAGRKWGTGHIACSTRPRKIASPLKANLSAAGLFPLPKREDREAVAADIGVPVQVLEAQWNQLPRKTKSLLWWDGIARSIQPVHSLPA